MVLTLYYAYIWQPSLSFPLTLCHFAFFVLWPFFYLFFFLSFISCVCVSFYSESTFTPFCFRHSTPNLQFLSNSIDAMGAVHIWSFSFFPPSYFRSLPPLVFLFSQAVVFLLSSLLLNECVIITYHDFFFDSFYFSFVRSFVTPHSTYSFSFQPHVHIYIFSIITCTKKKS